MASSETPVILATRGSPLALAQARSVLAQCQAAIPDLRFELRIIKTTGDKLQTASLAKASGSLPKGLFTKELEAALLAGEADLAVHSLKDLPTDLPDGLVLGAVGQRADVRDVLIYRAAAPTNLAPTTTANLPLRGFAPQSKLTDLPPGATIATASTRRREQLLALRSDLRVVEIRGNVGTRLQKVAERAELDATVLAAAGLDRLGFRIESNGRLRGPPPTGDGSPQPTAPRGLLAAFLPPEVMLPCVGQAAIGIEIRAQDERSAALCARLNHAETSQCVTAERAFLQAMGGGCQSPVAAHAELIDGRLRLRAVSFRSGQARHATGHGRPEDPIGLGREVAAALMQPEL